MSLKNILAIAKLNNSNYPQWVGEVSAYFRSQHLLKLIKGLELRPTEPSAITSAYTAQVKAWEDKEEEAAGIIFLVVEQDQRIHLTGIEDDPVKMWKKLEGVHMARRAGARFNAYDDLFSIRKKEDESLMSLTNRIDGAIRTIQNLRPKDFTLQALDEELQSMAMIRSLPDDYSNFVSSLLIMDKLDKATV